MHEPRDVRMPSRLASCNRRCGRRGGPSWAGAAPAVRGGRGSGGRSSGSRSSGGRSSGGRGSSCQGRVRLRRGWARVEASVVAAPAVGSGGRRRAQLRRGRGRGGLASGCGLAALRVRAWPWEIGVGTGWQLHKTCLPSVLDLPLGKH